MSNAENQEEGRKGSYFFFPLRTNVHYFDSTNDQVALVERAKQASLLYDNIIFEAGLYNAVVWRDEEHAMGPSVDMHIPPQDLTEDILASISREFKPAGGESYVMIDEHVFASGEVERRQYAEFHTLHKVLNKNGLPWMRIIPVPIPTAITTAAGSLAMEDDRKLRDLLADKPHFLRAKLLKNLNIDLLLSAHYDCAISIDAIFEPLLQRKAQPAKTPTAAPGMTTLRLAVPNIIKVPWDEVVDIREEESLKAFRRKIFEIEQTVRSVTSVSDVADLPVKIFQKMLDELLLEMKELLPKGKEVAADVIADFLLGFIPGASTVMTGLTGIGQLAEAKQSWLTAFIKLRRTQS